MVVRVKESTAMITLGRQGENHARRIQFNLSPWQMEYGIGTPALIHKRNGDHIAYPVPLDIEGMAAYWDVTSADTENVGNGKCELTYYVDNVIVKSAIFQTNVQPSMNDEIGNEPEALPNWIDKINLSTEAANDAAKKAVEAAEAATKAAEDISTGNFSLDNIATDEEVNEMLDKIFE